MMVLSKPKQIYIILSRAETKGKSHKDENWCIREKAVPRIATGYSRQLKIQFSPRLCMFESETKDCDLVLKLENMQSTNSVSS